MTTAFLVVVSVVSSVVFGGPPYNFDAGIVGLMSIGPLIASFIGMVISGPAVDWMARYLAKRNNGVFEAEFRLPALLVMLVCEIIGFAVWGAVQSAGGPWIGPEILYSLINLGQVRRSENTRRIARGVLTGRGWRRPSAPPPLSPTCSTATAQTAQTPLLSLALVRYPFSSSCREYSTDRALPLALARARLPLAPLCDLSRPCRRPGSP